MTRIAYVNRRPFELLDGGADEDARRLDRLRAWAGTGTTVEARSVHSGPASIESMYEEYLSIPPTAEIVEELEREGVDGVVVGCYADPGLDALREISDLVIVGPGTASMALAVTLGHRFSILTINAAVAPGLRRLSWEIGTIGALASIRHLDVSVLDLELGDQLLDALVDLGHTALADDGADVLILGCMSLAFLDVAEELSARLDVPVVNPAWAALSLCEATVAMGLRPSRAAYPRPARLGPSGRVADLLVSPSRPAGRPTRDTHS